MTKWKLGYKNERKEKKKQLPKVSAEYSNLWVILLMVKKLNYKLAT